MTVLALQLILVGGTSVWAEESSVRVQEQTAEGAIDQNQSVSTDGTAEDIEQNGDPSSDITQEQSSNDNSAHSKQTNEIHASQEQTVTNADHLDANQQIDGSMESNQSQKVNGKDQNLETNVTTDQKQSIHTEDGVEHSKQEQSTDISTTQESKSGNSFSQKQDTSVTLKETQEANTSGNANMEQNQGVKADGTHNEETGEIQAGASNKLEIIKEAAKTIVKVLQTISINEQMKEEFEHEYVLEEGDVSNTQEYSHTFNWGTVYILNKVLANLEEDDSVFSWMESLIKLEFSSATPTFVEQEDSDSDDDGLSDDEERILGTDPHNQDTDGDGVSDYFEVKFYLTNPLNKDTDGDRLTDGFEIIYHSSAKGIHDVTDVNNYNPVDLNPLMKNTNNAGPMDTYEDFDNDDLNNLQEQRMGASPFISNK
jgi:hypothetical protein